MTANLLTHSNLFACGIASSHNRTDTIWISIRATQLLGSNGCIYQNVPSFMNADEMKTTLLLTMEKQPGNLHFTNSTLFSGVKGFRTPVRMPPKRLIVT
jgi:hypothetical protein